MYKSLPKILTIVLAGLMVWGFYRLFELRFASGDVYPVGSSQRSDPVGTRAFYEALKLQPGLQVERLLLPLERRRPPQLSTLMLLGLTPEDLMDPETPFDWVRVETFIRRGGRVVLSLNPETVTDYTNTFRRLWRTAMVTTNTQGSDVPHRLWDFLPTVDLSTNTLAHRTLEQPSENLPNTLYWTSVHGFTPLSPEWKVHYHRGNLPVLLERELGYGSLILVGSSFLLSNQGLRTHSTPDFLAWLVGPYPFVLFDETHLGLRADPSLMGLLRTYRLGGAFAGLLVVVGLYLWRQSVRHPASRAQTDPLAPITGRDNHAGLVNLVRRSIPNDQLTAESFSVWKQSLGSRPPISDDCLADLQNLVDRQASIKPRQRDPVAVYQAMQERLHR